MRRGSARAIPARWPPRASAAPSGSHAVFLYAYKVDNGSNYARGVENGKNEIEIEL